MMEDEEHVGHQSDPWDPEFVKAALAKREYEVDFTELLQWDARRKEIIAEGEALKAERNRINKEIPRLKKEGADVAAVMAQMKESGEKVKSLDEELRQVEAKIEEFVAALPNLPADDVVAGGKENNQVVKVFGEKPVFNFEAKNHVDLCTSLGLIDYERSVKLAGNGYWPLHRSGRAAGVGAAELLHHHPHQGRLHLHAAPHILTYECGYTAGQFPKFKEDVYRVSTGDDSFHFLLPTAETALINLYRGEILEEKDLPKRMFAYTPCYRSEAGTYRASERGMIRGHQFNKVEMFGSLVPRTATRCLRSSSARPARWSRVWVCTTA